MKFGLAQCMCSIKTTVKHIRFFTNQLHVKTKYITYFYTKLQQIQWETPPYYPGLIITLRHTALGRTPPDE
jgi:hypothetical protein